MRKNFLLLDIPYRGMVYSLRVKETDKFFIKRGEEIMQKHSVHTERLIDLKRIEGQVKGIQRMIEDKKYCIDIVNQVYAVISGLNRVAENILTKHIRNCVHSALKKRSKQEIDKKIQEIMIVIKRMNR